MSEWHLSLKRYPEESPAEPSFELTVRGDELGELVVEDCRTLLRSVLGEGVTPELRQEILSALALNVHGETGQVERVRRVRRCGWCDSTGVYRDKDTDDVGPCPFCWEEG